MKQFYVYGLVDPRTNEIFYIGKGKGGRVFHHTTEKEIHQYTNKRKVEIIREIKKAGLEVQHTIIAQNLNEEAAFLLEKLLIHRIGRSLFYEGSLTNIAPGGIWHKKLPFFIKKEDLPSLESIQADYPEIAPILVNFPHVAKEFTSLQCPNNPQDENLYVFDSSGKKIHVFDITTLIKSHGLFNAIDLINVIKDTPSPVYAWKQVWSKSNIENFEDTSQIPFENFDIIDISFIRKINNALSKKQQIVEKCFYQNGSKLCEAKIKNDGLEICLEYFYSNSTRKHVSTSYDRKLNGNCISWYPNGKLREETEYINNKRQIQRCFYPSGNLKMVQYFHKDGSGKSVKCWYDNGQLSFQSNEDGTSVNYSEEGRLISNSIRTGYLHEGGNVVIREYSVEGNIKKETKQYFVDGLLHFYEKTFYDTGELKTEVDYTDGHQNKIIKTYKKNGEVTIKYNTEDTLKD